MNNDSPSPITASTELRQLRNVLEKIVELIDADETILDLLMGNITKDPSDVSSGSKFSDDHRRSLMSAADVSRRTAASIFIDEWITMAERRTRKLPTVQNLLDVLLRCQLYRLADFVADVSSQPRPTRPSSGPAKRVDISIPGEVELMLDGIAYPFDSVDSQNRDQRSKPSPNSPQINLSRSTNQTNENNLSVHSKTPNNAATLMSHPFHVNHSNVDVRTNLMEFSRSSMENSNIPMLSALQLNDEIIPETVPAESSKTNSTTNGNLPAVLDSNFAESSGFMPAISMLKDHSSEIEVIQESRDMSSSESDD